MTQNTFKGRGLASRPRGIPRCTRNDIVMMRAIAGVSLVEILISLAVFSVGIVGLYMSMQDVNKNLRVSMQRDLESTYANMLIGQVNPYEAKVETVFDLTDNNNKGTISLPNGRTIYYLRDVRSTSTAADVKIISVYFYHNAADAVGSYYRQFKRQIALPVVFYDLTYDAVGAGGSTVGFCKDPSGEWTRLGNTIPVYSLTANGYTAGLDTATMGGTALTSYQANGTNGGDVTGIPVEIDSGDIYCDKYDGWRSAHTSNTTRLIYVFPASQNVSYTVSWGLEEADANVPGSGSRIMDVKLNTVTVDSAVNVYALAGNNKYTAITRSYTVQPVLTGGVYTITVEFTKNGGNYNPRVSWISIARNGQK